MSSFLGNLAKGFVRSAVNQVGRDAGRCVSNNVYGDRHSTPYRNVSGGGSGRIAGYGDIEVESMMPMYPTTSSAMPWIIFAFFFNFLGGAMLMVNGYIKWTNRNMMKAQQVISQAVYVVDGRRKGGVRYDGHNRGTRKIVLQADETAVEANAKVAKLYIVAGAAICAVWAIMIFVSYVYQH